MRYLGKMEEKRSKKQQHHKNQGEHNNTAELWIKTLQYQDERLEDFGFNVSTAKFAVFICRLWQNYTAK